MARQVGLVRLRQDVDSHFVRYALSSSTGQDNLGAHTMGSVQQVINLRDLKNVALRLPPLKEQHAITHILGALDDKIELNRRMSETLEAMARALFKSWFVDFDPVRADAGLLAHGKAMPKWLTTSSLGDIPQGWTATTLGEIATQQRDPIDPRGSPDEAFSHFSLPAFDDGHGPRAQSGEDIKSVKYRVPTGSVLLSKLNPAFPRVWLVEPERHVQPICSTEFLVLVPRPPTTRDYLYCLLESTFFRGALRSLATGTSGSHQRARPQDVLDLPVLRPPSGVLSDFARIAAPLLERGLAARRESVTLAALRDTLLPRLISGELRVPEAQRIAVEAGA